MLFLRYGTWKLKIGSSARALCTQLPRSKEASTKKMSSSNSPCAACKFRRQKCTQECVFAPYFPPDQPQKFANVQKVFGASNVSKILNELNAVHREDAVNSLAYEAEARLRDPVYGCVGLISILQHKLKQIQFDLHNARKELAECVGAPGLLPILPHGGFVQHHPNNLSSSTVMPYNMSQMMSLSSGTSNSSHQQFVIREPHHQLQNHQQLLDGQPLAAVVAAREQQMMRAYEHQHQQQQEFMGFNGGFDPSGPVGANGFNQMSSAAMSPSLALGSFDSPYQIQQQQQESTLDLQFQSQLIIHETQQQQRSGSEEGRSVGPS